MYLYLFCIFILILLSMFFSGSETAVYSYNRVKAAELARNGTGPLAVVYRKLNVFLPTVLFLNLLANTGMTVLATILTVEYFGGEQYLPLTGFILTIVILVFAEIIPKIFAVRFNNKTACAAAWPFVCFMFLLRPVTATLSWGCWIIQEFLPFKALPVFTSGELKSAVKEAVDFEILGSREGKILQNIVDFRQQSVKEFMTPRTEIYSMPVNTSIKEVRRRARLAGYTRFPVTSDDDIDSVIGCVHLKEVLMGGERNLEKILRPVYFAPESMIAGQLFHTLRETGIQQAMIVDEYGQIEGLVTVHDLIEELMGDISDEYTPESSWIAREEDNGWVLNATGRIDAINDKLNLDLPVDQGRTLGGFLFNLAGHLPARQERLIWGSWIFTVQVIRRKRITVVRLVQRGEQ